MDEKYYSVKELAEKFDVCELTILRKVRSGKLKSVKPFRDYRISESDLQEYIKSCKSGAGQSA